MARKRMIWPDFFTSESLTAEHRDTRLLFAGLWVYCDDFGRGKDNAALIKATVFPMDEDMTSPVVAAHMERLEAIGAICRFDCHSAQFHVPSWTDWQKVSHPTPTRLCPCPTHEREAHEAHESLSRAIPEQLAPNVVQVSSEKFISCDRPRAVGWDE